MAGNFLICVIHIINDGLNKTTDICLTQAKIAFDSGSDGIFLIPAEGGMKENVVIECYNAVRKAFPTQFIGINFMCSITDAAKLIPMSANALWIDKGFGVNSFESDVIQMKKILTNREWNNILFGGFFFKGNNSVVPDVNGLKAISATAEKYFDVLATSGPMTGKEININNLINIRSTSTKPLAVASGINNANVRTIAKYSNYLIVGTGVEKDSTDLQTIEFYESMGCPTGAVDTGHLDHNKIKELRSLIDHITARSSQHFP